MLLMVLFWDHHKSVYTVTKPLKSVFYRYTNTTVKNSYQNYKKVLHVNFVTAQSTTYCCCIEEHLSTLSARGKNIKKNLVLHAKLSGPSRYLSAGFVPVKVRDTWPEHIPKPTETECIQRWSVYFPASCQATRTADAS